MPGNSQPSTTRQFHLTSVLADSYPIAERANGSRCGLTGNEPNTAIMKSNLWQGGVTGSCLLGAIISSAAGPLQRSDVINDPVWVLHLDCDALRPTI